MKAAPSPRDASPPTPRRRLIGALAAAERGHRRRARAEVLAVLGEVQGDGPMRLAVGCVLFATRDYQRALEVARSVAEIDPGLRPEAIEIAATIAELIGWDQEVRELLEGAQRQEPSEPRWPARLTRVMVRAGAEEAALGYAQRAVALEGRSPGMTMELARLLAALGRTSEAEETAQRALTLAPARALRYRWGAAGVLADAGAVAVAVAVMRDVVLHAPEDPAPLARLGELALWDGRVEDAESLARRALALAANDPAGARLLGACAALRGDTQAAARSLDQALRGDPGDYLALTWRAEVALAQGALDRMETLLGQAIARAPGYHPVAWMLRFLALAAKETHIAPDAPLTEPETAEYRDVVAEIVDGSASLFTGAGTRGELVAVLREVLRRIGGNRSVHLTYRGAGGELVRVRARAGVRYASRQALRQIRGCPPEQVLAALDEVVRRYPASSLPICHRGELHLWLGNLAQARADLDAAIEINAHTRWAYIGLAGVDLEEDAPERSLRTSALGVRVMKGTVGPAVFVYRGEGSRRVGDLEAARSDLLQALAISDKRLGAWLNLALVEAGRGDREGFAAAWAHLLENARGLVSDAAAQLGIVVWGDPGEAPTRADQLRVVEQALAMARGNRSTGLTTYFTGAGRLRFVQSRVSPSEHLEAERRMLGHARRYLRRRSV